MSFTNELADYTNKKSLANRFRDRRFQFFEGQLKKIAPKKGIVLTILDVGGTESFWVNRGYHKIPNIHITLLNLTKAETKHDNMVSVVGNACNLSEYTDNTFDLVFSNSVIEHLYSYENQELMAKEVQRVGENYYIQTPNKYFFIEPHYLLPYFQFLPRKTKLFVLSKTRLSRGNKLSMEKAEDKVAEIQLLSLKDMKNLFPGANIFKEKFLGMNKSLTAYLMEKR